jgi:phospholipid-binding lipoprotein MlaA
VLTAIAVACVTIAGCTLRNQRSDNPDVRLGGNYAARSQPESFPSDTTEQTDYDPWEPVNECVFSFNHDLVDHYGLKPVATVWARLPELVTHGLVNAFDNIDMPKRFVNNVLQGRLQGANRELTRFLVNSTVGVAGIFDVATELGFEKSYADTGQTLGIYGIGPGPYLVLPFMQPLTLRDGIGYGADTFLDPIGYLAPFVANFALGGQENQ